MDITNPLVWGAPCFILLVIIELAYSKIQGHEDLYTWKDLFASGSMGMGAVLITPLVKIVSAATIFYLVYEFFNPEVDGVRQNIMGYASFGWAWYIWLVCQFLDDFCYYWLHRCNHTVRFMWAAHIVHHSSDHYNLGTGLRNGWFTILYKPFFYMWLPAVGFHPEMVLVCMGIEALWQFQLHTKYVKNLGIFEKFMNTHRQHQVHHAKNLEYLDKNHGGYLNMFDKIFGSWKDYDKTVDIEYGVVHEPNSYNPLIIVSHEYKDIWRDIKGSKSVKEVLMYIFGPPGWSPDGSTQTVRQMQREVRKQKEREAHAVVA